jgi:hypothetical protein
MAQTPSTQNVFATEGFRQHHGAPETNGLVNGAAYHDAVDYSRYYSLAEVAEAGGKISRVRLLTESVPGVGRLADVSYIHATLPDGRTVNVQNGLDNLTPMRLVKAKMIDWAKREGVFAKGLGLLDSGNWSTV